MSSPPVNPHRTVAKDRTVTSISIVGAGRVGRAAARALRGAGYEVTGPTGRGEPVARAMVVLLCVPDREIASAAVRVRDSAEYVGHTSGATPIGIEGIHFGLHPLRAFFGGEDADAFRGIGCAVAGTTPEALRIAEELAVATGAEPFGVADDQRAGYHAAASLSSNFVVTLLAAAETVAAASGLDAPDIRRHLAPLVRGTVENWASTGPRATLTGPIVRGDDATVARQRDAIAAGAPQLLSLFDELCESTRALSAARGATS